MYPGVSILLFHVRFVEKNGLTSDLDACPAAFSNPSEELAISSIEVIPEVPHKEPRD